MAHKTCVMGDGSRFLDRPVQTALGLYHIECFEHMDKFRGAHSEREYLSFVGAYSHSKSKSAHRNGKKGKVR